MSSGGRSGLAWMLPWLLTASAWSSTVVFLLIFFLSRVFVGSHPHFCSFMYEVSILLLLLLLQACFYCEIQSIMSIRATSSSHLQS